MWLLIALLGYLALAIVSVLDKFIVSDKAVAPSLFVFYSTAPLLPIWLLLPFGVRPLAGAFDSAVAIVAGVAFALGLWAMYVGFTESEVSHAGPLVGAAVAVCVVIFSQLFLAEQIWPRHYWATAFLVAGSLAVSFEFSQLHRGWHRGLLWGLGSGIGFALSHVASKYLYDRYGFYSGLVWSRGWFALVGVALLAHPAVRARWFSPARRFSFRRERPRPVRELVLVGGDKVLGVGGALLLQYATALGSVTLVNALAGVQYALLILAVGLLSRFAPRLFKEQYARGEGWQEALAVGLIAVGMGLLVA